MIEVYLNDWNFNRLALLDGLVSMEYTNVVSGLGTFNVVMPHPLPVEAKPDYIVEIVRNGVLEMLGFMRVPKYDTDEKARTTVSLGGSDMNELLTRRILNQPAGTSYTRKSGKSDDVMKALVREHLGTSAGNTPVTAYARGLSTTYFSVEANQGLGYNSTYKMSWLNLLDAIKTVAAAAITGGIETFWGIVPTSRNTIQFKTWINQPGRDLTYSSGSGVLVGVDYGNVKTAGKADDYSKEVSFCYVDRTHVAGDATRIAMSPWNLREGYRATDAGQSDERQHEANHGVSAGRPKRTLSAELQIEGVYCGDRITVGYLGQQYSCLIRALKTKLEPDGSEKRTCKVEWTGIAL